MLEYAVPVLKEIAPVPAGQVLLVANGDLRHSANRVCWAAQAKMEEVKGTTYSGIANQSKAVVPGCASFKQQVAVTTVNTGLEQVVVTVYWTVKGSETNIALTTLVANG